ncbi:MAG: DMT family transporter [Candidatus Korarchaeota archaeon]|nr:DMT family transporter [Candidatus Korarchaeota archaeon]
MVRSEPPLNPKLALAVGIAAVSTASILIRFSDSNPLIIAGYRMAFASLLMLILSASSLKQLRGLSSTEKGILLLSGVSLAAHFGTWTASLKYTSIAASTVIVDSSPIFVVLLSYLALGERVNSKEAAGIAISFLGASTIAMGHIDKGSNLFGDFLALIGSISLAAYLVAGRRLRGRLDLAPYTASVYGISGISLLLTAGAFCIPLSGYPLKEWAIFLALALIPSGLGHNSYNYALKYLKASIVSVSILGEPIGASILAAILLGELPRVTTVIGGALVLGGIYTAVTSQRGAPDGKC